MSFEPTFSICIPNYNYGRYIRETIQSVLDQSYTAFEVIVTDNASTDDSVQVVEAIRSDKIRLFRNPYNVGFAPNLDRAVRYARSEFIIVLSADDVMRPHALQVYAEVFQQLGSEGRNVLVGAGVDYFDDAGRVHHSTRRRDFFHGEPKRSFPLVSANGADAAVFDGRKVFGHVFPRMKTATFFCSTAYTRELYDRIGGYSSIHLTAPDAHFGYKAMLAGADIVLVDKVLFGYRVHGASQLQADRHDKTLKVPIDHYTFTIQFPDAALAKAGVRREDVIEALVDETCLNAALLEARHGDSRQAFRLLMFSWAVSPAAALRNPKTYLLPFMMLPVAGPLMARALYALRARWKRRAGPVAP